LADLEVNLPHLIKSLGRGRRERELQAPASHVNFDPATTGTSHLPLSYDADAVSGGG